MILFRGKRIDNGEWVEGCLDNRIGSRILTQRTCPTLNTTTYNTHQVDPKTVSQYIGIKDKNDVKIFEGDKLRYKHIKYDKQFKYTEVRYSKEMAGFTVNNNKYFSSLDLSCNNIEIIGNIYDKDQ